MRSISPAFRVKFPQEGKLRFIFQNIYTHGHGELNFTESTTELRPSSAANKSIHPSLSVLTKEEACPLFDKDKYQSLLCQQVFIHDERHKTKNYKTHTKSKKMVHGRRKKVLTEVDLEMLARWPKETQPGLV